MSMRRIAVMLLISLTLSACGFQLREQVRLPAGVNAIEVHSANALSPLVIELERALLANGVSAKGTKTATTQANAAKLELISEGIRREILSVNDRARVSEFLLIASAKVRLLDASDGSKELIAPFELSVRREYSFDEAQALGASQEEEIITAELQRELAQNILLKLRN
jgi:LPS-assembly lipoprotein